MRSSSKNVNKTKYHKRNVPLQTPTHRVLGPSMTESKINENIVTQPTNYITIGYPRSSEYYRRAYGDMIEHCVFLSRDAHDREE